MSRITKRLGLFLSVLCVFFPQMLFANKSSLIFRVIADQMVIQKSDVVNVRLSNEGTNNAIEIKLTKQATEKMAKMTRSNIGKRMQLSFGKTIISVPMIQSELGGQFQISTDLEGLAKQIVAALK